MTAKTTVDTVISDANIKNSSVYNTSHMWTMYLQMTSSTPRELLRLDIQSRLSQSLYRISLYTTTTTTIVLWPFVRDYPGEPVPEETLTHPPS